MLSEYRLQVLCVWLAKLVGQSRSAYWLSSGDKNHHFLHLGGRHQ